MTTLVTGGRGFVGRRLVDLLRERDTRVVSYNRDYATGAPPGVELVQGELFDIPRLVRTIEQFSVDRIIHTAGQSHPGVSIDLPLTTFAANADGTLAVFEAARLGGVTRIVNFSSECAYGNLDDSLVVLESTKPTPTTTYGVTKVAGELLGRVYNHHYGMSVASLRISEVYGPGLWMPSLLGDMLRSAVEGRPFDVAEGGDHPFQFVYVDDVARAAILASESGTLSQPTYNVTGGDVRTLQNAADRIVALIPDAQITLGGGYLSEWDRMGRLDLTAANRDFGYSPARAFDDGLKATADWVRGPA